MGMMVRDDGDGEYGGENHGDDIQSNHPQRVLTEAPPPLLNNVKKNCTCCSGSLPKITRWWEDKSLMKDSTLTLRGCAADCGLWSGSYQGWDSSPFLPPSPHHHQRRQEHSLYHLDRFPPQVILKTISNLGSPFSPNILCLIITFMLELSWVPISCYSFLCSP